MTNLLDQLKLGPLQWMQGYVAKDVEDSTTEQATLSEKTNTPEQVIIPYKREYNLLSKSRQQSGSTAFAPTEYLTSDSRILPIAPSGLPNLQPPEPRPTTQPPDTTQTARAGCVSPVEHDIPESTIIPLAPLQPKMPLNDLSSPRDSLNPSPVGRFGNAMTHTSGRDFEKYPIVPNAFRFASSHDLLASLSKKPNLQGVNEKEKREKEDIETGVDEEDHKTMDARKQAQKMADLLTARQDFRDRLKPFNFDPISPLHQKQTHQETEPLQARQ